MAPSISHYVSMWSHYQPAQCRNAHLDLEFPNTCFDHDRKAMLIELDRCQPTTGNGWFSKVYINILLGEYFGLTEWRNTAENLVWKSNCITQLTTCTVLVSYYRVNNVRVIACHRRMRNPHIRCHNLSKSTRQIMRVAASMHVLFWLKDEKPLPRTISHKAIIILYTCISLHSKQVMETDLCYTL